MTSLPVRAELTKLGALLLLDPKDLAYLSHLDASVIRKFREDAMDMMFAADRKRLEGSAAATRMVPAAISAKIATLVIPPRLAARVAGLTESGKAVDLASRLPVKYLADVAPFLDPRRVSAILGEVPNELVSEVAKILGRTGDYITMGRMVAHIKHEAIFQTLAHLDDYTLLQAGFVIEDTSRMPEIIHMLPEHRLISITEVADERGHWLEAMGLLDNLDDSLRRHLVNLVARQPHLMNGLVKCAYDEDLWDVALPLAPLMTEESLQTFVHVDVLHQREVVESLVDAAARLDLWEHVNPLLPLVDSNLGAHLAHALAGISDEHLDRLVGEVTRAGLKDALDAVALHDEKLAERIAHRNA
ncbi:hypothetical protein [Smaragdicoccus niigatensis]|uniref:hypothetical protein n=1 Tax=Smaragdicoccus niigatensis TaxID=359359 RepID=UPI00036AC0A3|nr:hypothetical protein [Smaragdicoccus niigatensis]